MMRSALVWSVEKVWIVDVKAAGILAMCVSCVFVPAKAAIDNVDLLERGFHMSEKLF